MGTVFGMISFLLRWWCCGRTKLILVTKPCYFDKTWVDSIAVSVFADIFIVLTNTDRQQDPNNYSDTVTRVLFRPGKSVPAHSMGEPWS